MKLDVDSFTLFVNHLEGVASVTIHKSVTVWGAAIAKQEADLEMNN